MKQNKVLICIITLILCTCLHLYSQNIISVEQLIAGIEVSEYLNPETALVLIGTRSGTFDPVNVPEDPMSALSDLGFIIPLLIREQIEQDNTVWTSYGAYSLLLMQLFDIPGGISYNLFINSHYAMKELQFRGLIDPKLHARQAISGSEAIALLYAIEEQLENGDIR